MRWTSRLVGLMVLAAVLSAAPIVAAQESAQPPAAQEAQPPAAQDGFVPVKPGELDQEQLPAAPLVFTAYSVIWMALIVYVFLLWRRIATVERELKEVHARLQARRP